MRRKYEPVPFSKFVRHMSQSQNPDDKALRDLALYMLARRDSSLRADSDEAYSFTVGSFPIHAGSSETVTEWFKRNAPQKLEAYYRLADRYRLINRAWVDTRPPAVPDRPYERPKFGFT